MCKVLVIDDDIDMLDIIQSLLTRNGFDVQIDNNWQNGLEGIIEFDPQIILLDVFLSGVDGLDICKQLKANPHTSHIPVVILSAYPRIAESAIDDYGADDFIAKPFEVNELVSKIHSVLMQTPV
jgi:DNA-binding response OmpR family regulator